MEASWTLLGLSWGSLGALLGVSWGLLGSLGGSLGAILEAILEAIDQRRGVLYVGAFKIPLGAGRSWVALGAIVGALGAVLGASWAPLGALVGHLGAMLKPPKPIGREKARRQSSLKNILVLKDFCLLGPSLGGSEGAWSRPGVVLRAFGGKLEPTLNHLGLSCAILEAILVSLGPFCSYLGPSWQLQRPAGRPV